MYPRNRSHQAAITTAHENDSERSGPRYFEPRPKLKVASSCLPIRTSMGSLRQNMVAGSRRQFANRSTSLSLLRKSAVSAALTAVGNFDHARLGNREHNRVRARFDQAQGRGSLWFQNDGRSCNGDSSSAQAPSWIDSVEKASQGELLHQLPKVHFRDARGVIEE